MSKHSLVTVETFDTPVAAHLARMRLEQAEIPAFIRDEHVIGLDPVLSSVMGGIRLDVPKSRLEEARRILAECEHVARDRLSGFKRVADADRCPQCGIKLHFGTRPAWKRVVVTVLSFFSIAGGVPTSVVRTRECRRCGYSTGDE
jgi:hypothetical protein